MGVQLGEILLKKELKIEHLTGRKIAIDAYNTLYQFLSIIRQPDGTPLMDTKGRVTSHLTGLLYRTSKLLENGVKPCYVFDGKPPEAKKETIKSRMKVRKQAKKKWDEALEKGDLEEARVHAQAAIFLTTEMVESAKQVLDAMGIPYVEAPGEGEAQAAYMCQQGDVWAAASQDFDSLLFGAPKLIRNLTITGKRKLPRKNVYIEIEPELIELDDVLKDLKINRKQLIGIGILCGTDYNPGIKGIGPKRALAAMQEGKKLADIYKENEIEPALDLKELEDIFLKPNIVKKYKLEWKEPDAEKMLKILCHEYDFSQDRVHKVINTLKEKASEKETQARLNQWG